VEEGERWVAVWSSTEILGNRSGLDESLYISPLP
jgi:hypothetical protein